EIMTIALAAIPPGSFWMQAATLAVVGIGITALVYGGVALIVKADDVGLHMARKGWLAATRAAGYGLVKAMPGLLQLLSTVGAAFCVHGLELLGLAGPAQLVAGSALAAGRPLPQAESELAWLFSAGLSGLFGLALGLLLLPIGNSLIAPVWTRLTRQQERPR